MELGITENDRWQKSCSKSNWEKTKSLLRFFESEIIFTGEQDW